MAQETEIRHKIKELKNFQGLPSELDPIYKELLLTFRAYRLANPDEPNIGKYDMINIL